MLASCEIAKPDRAVRAGTVPRTLRDSSSPSALRRSSSKAAVGGLTGIGDFGVFPPTSACSTNVRSSPAVATPTRNCPCGGVIVAMVLPVNMFLTWAVPRPTGSRTMYGCTAGAASAAGSGPAARQAPGCQVPGAFGHDGGLTSGLAGRPPSARPVPASPRVTPTRHRGDGGGDRARLSRPCGSRAAGPASAGPGCRGWAGTRPGVPTPAAARAGSSSMGHLLVGLPQLAVQPLPGRRQPVRRTCPPRPRNSVRCLPPGDRPGSTAPGPGAGPSGSRISARLSAVTSSGSCGS